MEFFIVGETQTPKKIQLLQLRTYASAKSVQKKNCFNNSKHQTVIKIKMNQNKKKRPLCKNLSS